MINLINKNIKRADEGYTELYSYTVTRLLCDLLIVVCLTSSCRCQEDRVKDRLITASRKKNAWGYLDISDFLQCSKTGG